MKQEGQIVLFAFPQTDLAAGKLRPALLLGRLPGPYDDWLLCMISSQLRHFVSGFDEIGSQDDIDFEGSGLKVASMIRVGRLAVVDAVMLRGATGEIAPERLERIKARLADWLRTPS